MGKELDAVSYTHLVLLSEHVNTKRDGGIQLGQLS